MIYRDIPPALRKEHEVACPNLPILKRDIIEVVPVVTGLPSTAVISGNLFE
jgi:hypothetical protein